MRHISEVAPVKGARYITRRLDEFEHRGPNGLHKCLVLEPMGPNVFAMVEELPQFNPRRIEMKIRYPVQMAKSILKQYLQALAFLHENGIAHGNIHLANILFPLSDIDSTPEDLLRQAKDAETNSISPPVQRLDGKQDKWAPEYLCVPQPLVPFTCYTEGFKLKLCDMSQGQSLYSFFLANILYSHLTAFDSLFHYRPTSKILYSTVLPSSRNDFERRCQPYR